MSKGLGKIERYIKELIYNCLNPQYGPKSDLSFVNVRTWDVIHVFHPGYDNYKGYINWSPTRYQKQAAVRAMHSFVRKNPQYALAGGKGRKSLFLYDPATPLSVAWMKGSLVSRGRLTLCEARKWLETPIISGAGD
jgi:hypothetical protein